MDKNCIFCKIVNHEIPSATLYEDENFLVILDISPAAKGHAILISKKHIPNVFELDEETASKVLPVVARVARAIKEELNCDGMNILQNNGEAAGQTVFHYHIHFIPRFSQDSVTITWNQGGYEEGEAKSLADAIRGRIQ
jgi:Diadenosine tetraphosphate (Ap4A) hydrolase and other HIT family hydrolases